MFDIQEEKNRLTGIYTDLAAKLINFPEHFLTEIADLLFFEYNMIHVDVYNTPENEFWLEAHKVDRAELIDAYFAFRGVSIYYEKEVVYFESIKNISPVPYLSVYIPNKTGKDASVIETNIDKRNLRKLLIRLKKYKHEYKQLEQHVYERQEQIKQELSMLKTYKEVAGE